MKVLIVEDDEDMRHLLKLVTEGLHLDTTEAADGESALLNFDSMDSPDPDLVLLDLHLPEMSGEAVFDAIRSRSNSTIVIVTADILLAPEFIEKADGVFTKPFKLTEIVVKLNSLLSQRSKGERE